VETEDGVLDGVEHRDAIGGCGRINGDDLCSECSREKHRRDSNTMTERFQPLESHDSDPFGGQLSSSAFGSSLAVDDRLPVLPVESYAGAIALPALIPAEGNCLAT